MGKLTLENFLNYKKIKDLTISGRHKDEIRKILTEYDSKNIKNRVGNIVNFIKFDVDGCWLDRLNIIVNDLKNDSSSLKSFKIRYGNDVGVKLFNEKNEKTKIDLNFFINKFGENKGYSEWENFKIKSKTPWGLEACVKKYGKENGKKKWEERLNKKIKTQNECKKIKPYRNGRTLKEYQNRYGFIKGYDLWKLRNDRCSYRFSVDYYIEKYGDILGKVKWEEYKKNMSKTSLISFINRYGELYGKQKYKQFIDKIRHANTIEYYIEKYGKERGKEKFEEVLLSRIKSFPGYSKISQELFWGLYEEIFDYDKKNVNFAELNEEYMFFIHEDWCKVFSVDFKFGNKIIEFDGDYWHGNDKQKEIDNKRDKYLMNRGYVVLRIKESDFKKNKNKVIKKCKRFIYG